AKQNKIISNQHAVILNLFQDLSRVSYLERGLRGGFCLLLILISFNSFSQKIIAGPIVGAVTDTSAEVLFINNRPSSLNDYPVWLLVYLDTSDLVKKFHFKLLDSVNFINNVDTSFFKTKDIYFKEGIVHKIFLNHLIPNSIYNYCVSDKYSERDTFFQTWNSGSFKTFPSPNTTSNFTFTFGSCSENFRDDSVFIEMQKHHPDLFLHLGDWTYPDHAYYPGLPTQNNHRFFVANPEQIKESFLIRYNLPNMKNLLSTTAVDYVFDDEDGIWDDFSKHTYCDLQLINGKTMIKEIPFPDSLRDNLLTSYHTYFPGYVNPEQPKEAYHSFVYGNTEVFFLDTRSTRSPNSEVFHQNKKGVWKFKASASHQILDSTQLNWLLDGLKNSKADWKIIVSGTSFNKDYKKILDICLLKAAQNRYLPNKLTGIYVAAAMSAMWFSYPATQGKLINFCHDNKIKNVFVCSGDVHTSSIDDGKHSGFPEIVSANLGQENTKLASIVYNDLRLNLWNQGGQGIGNKNFNDAFGKVEVMGKDSVRLSCIDKYGTTICSYTLKDGFIPKKYNIKRHSKITFGQKLRAVKNAVKIAVHNK
ncbi:MAG: alkaline phosphatase D family protein, partial [Chitinophagales bacterium]|nr:alkaline phosphatase D family protein [Chitinophagales bacterium]